MSRHIKPSELRHTSKTRGSVRETRISKDDFVLPLFFTEGKGKEPIGSMPGVEKMGEAALLKEIERIENIGIKAVLLFAASKKKDKHGSSSYDEKSAFHKTIKRIKENSNITLITDVCLCAYTDHGHCGIIRPHKSAAKSEPRQGREVRIDNKKTIETLARIALSYAKAGADMVAPSAMAGGQVGAIRKELNKNGFLKTKIMGYSAKYASNFYGPFRDIYDSSPSFGDRRSYQMDFANRKEALKEVKLDIKEGADIVMVKPAICFLDIISDVKKEVQVPVAAYNVSGEYSMIKAAAEKGWLDEAASAMEMLTSIKRAGADIIITYWAKEATEWLKTLD